MRPPTSSTALFAIIAGTHAIAVPVVERVMPSGWKHPIVHLPLPKGFNLASTGIVPNVTLLNKADFLTPGTVVPGSPGSYPSNVEKRDILGTENRFLQVKKGNPWDYIGRFEWPSDTGLAICTASLVGPRHLVAARHCLDREGKLRGSYTFKPNYDQGPRGYTSAQVTDAIYLTGETSPGNDCTYTDDWVVMVLDQRLGDKYGWFGVKDFDTSKAGKANFWHEGYPIDLGGANRPYVQDKITGRINTDQCNNGAAAPILTDADSAGGQSGGPLWLLPEADGVRYLYGVASWEDPEKTGFAGRQAFVNAIAYARANYP